MTDLFSSEQVRLRALEPEDLDFLYLWENDAELRESGNTLVPIGRNRLKEYIEKSSEGLMELGMMRLHRRVAVGLFVIPEYRRLGIAVESLRKISHYVLDYLRLHQIIAYVLEDNKPSRMLFEAAGFEHTATLRQWMWHAGDYSDVLLYQLWKR